MGTKSLDQTNFLAGTLLNLATVSMIIFVLWQVPSQPQPAFSYTPPDMKRSATVGVPSHLEIASLGIELPVQPGSFDPASQNWTLSEESALHALATVPLNDANGATLLYGHATSAVFGNLPQLKPGDIAKVASDTGATFYYAYQSRIDVDPTDTRVFDTSGKPRLVLQTCTGPWDSMRSLYTFTLQRVERTTNA